MQGVYAWVNLTNGKVYVGSATDLARRKYHHINKLKAGKHHNAHLQAAWVTYGQASFTFEVLEEVEDLLWLRAREQAWIIRTQAANRKFGYNTTKDAWAPVTTEETKAKLRQSWVNRKTRGDFYKFTAEDQEKSRKACLGKSWSESQRLLLSESRKQWTPERRAAQAERCRKQNLIDPTRNSRGGRKGTQTRWNPRSQ